MDWRFNALEKRPYRIKNALTEFFCPLCRTPRAFSCKPRLSQKNYAQIILLSIAVSSLLFPLMEWRSLFSFFVILAFFEAGVRTRFRKEIPCPYCGFDASWYKKDVKIARRLVSEFWEKKKQGKAKEQIEAEFQAMEHGKKSEASTGSALSQ